MSGHGQELIGRESDLVRVAELLDASPLVTLTGVGGVGKTTLARACADRVDGVVWVDLAPVGDREAVIAAFMRALGVEDLGSRAPAEALRVALSGRQALLVVDNAEHVVDAVSELLTPLVRDAPGLGVLVTSREALMVPGESHFVVAPLDEPAAVELFVRRVGGIAEEELAAAARISRGLDGVPLAIEFAAARTRSSSVAEVEASLGRVLELGGDAAGARPRHLTLRAALGWSHDLLDDPERVLLRRLSVFAGSFALDSVEAVCSGDEPSLRRLVDRSLVTAQPGEARYRLLETVRQFAADQLDRAGEREAIEERHTQFFVELAETLERRLWTSEQLHWHRRVRADYDNVLAALQRSVLETGGLSSDGTRIAGALGWWWLFIDGRQSEAFRWLERAAERLGAPDADAAVGKAAILSFLMAFNRGEVAAVSTGAAAALLQVDGTAPWHAFLARLIVNLPALVGDPAVLDSYLQECSQELARAGDDGFGQLLAATAASQIALMTGDLERRRAGNERRLEIARRMGDGASKVLPLAGLGLGALQDGDPERGTRLLGEAIEAARPLQSALMTPTLLGGAAGVAVARSDWTRATRLFGATDGHLERSGTQINSANRAEFDEWAASCRASLGEAEFDRAWQAGWKLTAEAAMDLAEDVIAERSAEAGALTLRQREVAKLVAQGKSNREIAEALVISEHTVERHIVNILRSLRLNSRVQIATWFVAESA